MYRSKALYEQRAKIFYVDGFNCRLNCFCFLAGPNKDDGSNSLARMPIGAFRYVSFPSFILFLFFCLFIFLFLFYFYLIHVFIFLPGPLSIFSCYFTFFLLLDFFIFVFPLCFVLSFYYFSIYVINDIYYLSL
jgi:hypothetical protein